MNPPLLEVRHLTMRFGGLVAIDDLSLTARNGEITAIIGPNGAGKTTVFNCLTGFYKPTVGELTFHAGGQTLLLEQMEGFRIARAGVARTFQNIRLFGGMTVLDEQAVEIEGVGFAGVKGFVGGFGRGELAPFGEPEIKAFVDIAVNEARKLENGLRSLRTEKAVAVLHYSPVLATLEGEPIEIFQYLGSQRLADAIDRFDNVRAVFHGHAHHGSYEGRTLKGTPVYNCAQFVVSEKFGRPYALVEI